MSKEYTQDDNSQKFCYSRNDCLNDIKQSQRDITYVRCIRLCRICKKYMDISLIKSFELDGIPYTWWICKIPCEQNGM